ncbi:MAG: type II toxin-antitoxin system Phd/YefM family antitoxin [Actinomycetes bacterium]
MKNRLSEVVDRLERPHGRVVITKHGRPAAVVMSVEDLEGLEETLDVLSDSKLMRRLRKADAEIAADEAAELTKAEAFELIERHRWCHTATRSNGRPPRNGALQSCPRRWPPQSWSSSTEGSSAIRIAWVVSCILN